MEQELVNFDWGAWYFYDISMGIREYYGISKSIWQKNTITAGYTIVQGQVFFFGWHGLTLRCDRWRFPKIGAPLNHPFCWFSIKIQPFFGEIIPMTSETPQMSIEERPAICRVTTKQTPLNNAYTQCAICIHLWCQSFNPGVPSGHLFPQWTDQL